MQRGRRRSKEELKGATGSKEEGEERDGLKKRRVDAHYFERGRGSRGGGRGRGREGGGGEGGEHRRMRILSGAVDD